MNSLDVELNDWSLDSLPRSRNKSIKYLLQNFVEKTEEKNLAHQTIERGKVSFIFLKGKGIKRDCELQENFLVIYSSRSLNASGTNDGTGLYNFFRDWREMRVYCSVGGIVETVFMSFNFFFLLRATRFPTPLQVLIAFKTFSPLIVSWDIALQCFVLKDFLSLFMF